MGIKEDRKARRSEFISLRHVIMAMSEEAGVSVSDVAGELILWLEKPGKNPVFCRQNSSTLRMEEWGEFEFPILKKVARLGELDWMDHSPPSSSDLDEFGWNRQEIGTFLLVFLGHLPNCCDPDWEPGDVLNQTPASHYLVVSPATASESAIDYQESDHLVIKGALYANLLRAIRAFPDRFPGYKNKMPRAGTVNNWIKDSGIETTNRPAQVFATMIVEHFSTDS